MSQVLGPLPTTYTPIQTGGNGNAILGSLPTTDSPLAETIYQHYGEFQDFKPFGIDEGILMGMNQEDYRSQMQGFWSRLGNGLGRASIGTAAFTVQGVQNLEALAVGALAAPFTDINAFDFVANNPINLALDDFEDWYKAKIPIYKPRNYEGQNFFERLADPRFYTDEFADGMAFLASAYLTGLGAAKAIGSSAKLANTFSKAGEFMGGVAKVGELSAEGVQLGAKGTKFGNWLIKNAGSGATWAQKSTFALANRSFESTFEATQSYKQIREESFPKFYKQLLEQGYSDKDAARIADEKSKAIAGKGASNVFLWNYLALPTDLWEAGLIFKGAGTAAESRKLLRTALAEKAAKGAEKVSLPKLFNTVVGDFKKGFVKGALWEGVYEENLQQAIQNWQQNNFVNDDKQNWADGIIGGMIENFGTIQGGVSIGLGALQGGLFGGSMNAYGNRQQRKQARGTADLINQTLEDVNNKGFSLLTPIVKNIYKKDPTTGKLITDNDGNPIVNQDALDELHKSLQTMSKAEGNKNIAALRDDKATYHLWKKLQIAQLAHEYFTAGLKDDLIDKLQQYATMTDEDIQKLGISHLEEDINGNPLKPSQIAAKYIGYVNELADTYDLVESKYPAFDNNFAEDRTHRRVIFLNAAKQLALREERNTSVLKELTLRTEQHLDSKGDVSPEGTINNLIDRIDFIDEFIKDKEAEESLNSEYKKKLVKQRNELEKELDVQRELYNKTGTDKMRRLPQTDRSLKADLQEVEWMHYFGNILDTENSLHDSVDDHDKFTDAKKWKTYKAELEAEEKRQDEAIEKAQKEKIDQAVTNITTSLIGKEKDKAALTAALQEYDKLKKSVPFQHEGLNNAIADLQKKIQGIDIAEAKRAAEAEAARKAAEEAKKKKGKTGTTVITDGTNPDVITPHTDPLPSDKAQEYETARDKRDEAQEQRSVSTAFSFDEAAIDNKNKGNKDHVKLVQKLTNGDTRVTLSDDPHVMSQEPILSYHLNVGDVVKVSVELDNPITPVKKFTEQNFPLVISDSNGNRLFYYNTYTIEKGLEYLNPKHKILLTTSVDTLSIPDRELLDFFNKRLELVKVDRAVAWAQYDNGKGTVDITTTVTDKTNGQILNQQKTLRGQPFPFTPEQRPGLRLLTQAIADDDFELALFRHGGVSGEFTSDGVSSMSNINVAPDTYQYGIVYAFVKGPAYNGTSSTETRVPLRLVSSRLKDLAFGDHAIDAIYDELFDLKEGDFDQAKMKRITDGIGQLTYVESIQKPGVYYAYPEKFNFVIDWTNTDPQGNISPRITMKLGGTGIAADTAYLTFYLRDDNGNPSPGDSRLFTNFSFHTTNEKAYSKEDFYKQYPDMKKRIADDVFKMFLGERYFHIDSKQFQNKDFEFQLIPKESVDFRNYKKALVTHGIVKTDAAKVMYPSGESFNFYNPEVQFAPFGKPKPTNKSVYKDFTPISDLEAKKADIERRRQEELNKLKSKVSLQNDFGDRYSIIFNENKIGIIEIPTDLEGDTISLGDININPKYRNKGLGVESYKAAIDLVNKPIESISRTPEAKRVWVSLVKQGLAKIEGNSFISTTNKEINAKYDAELAALETAPPKKKAKATKTKAAKEELPLPESPIERQKRLKDMINKNNNKKTNC